MVADKSLQIETIVDGGEDKGVRKTLMFPEPRKPVENDVRDQSPGVTLPTALLPAYPNPFNPETTIAYELDTVADVTLRIFDIRGRVVQEFRREGQQPGRHEIVWRGDDGNGRRMASGVYFVKLAAGSYCGVGRVVMIK